MGMQAVIMRNILNREDQYEGGPVQNLGDRVVFTIDLNEDREPSDDVYRFDTDISMLDTFYVRGSDEREAREKLLAYLDEGGTASALICEAARDGRRATRGDEARAKATGTLIE